MITEHPGYTLRFVERIIKSENPYIPECKMRILQYLKLAEFDEYGMACKYLWIDVPVEEE